MRALLFFLLAVLCVGWSEGASKKRSSSSGFNLVVNEKEKKAKEREEKKAQKESKKAANAVNKSMAKITPVLRPDVEVDESELESLKKAAEEGDAASMIRLGHYYMMHHEENYVNEQTAGEYFRKAAEADDAAGAVWLGIYEYYMNPEGLNLEGREKKLLTEAEAAAEKGSLEAMHLVGLLSSEPEEKKEWFEKAATKGFVPSMRALAETIIGIEEKKSNGKSVTAEARAWCELAIKNGDFRSYELLASDGKVYSGSMADRPEIDYNKFQAYLEKKLECVRKLKWVWYDQMFDTRILGSRYSWGGQPCYELLSTYKEMYHLANRVDKNTHAICRRTIKELESEAKGGNTYAQAAMVCLGQNWIFWMGRQEGECPFKVEPYRAMLKEKADAGDLHVARVLEIGCVPK